MVSIIVSVYNCEKYIEKCLKSILIQNYKEYEILVINDGSTDNTLNIVENIQKENSKIKIINKKNEGLSAARNTGLDYAKGEYILFIDGDDCLGCIEKEDTNIISSLVSASKNCDMVVGKIDIVYEANYNIKDSDDIYYAIPFNGIKVLESKDILRFNVSACAKLYKKNIIDKYNLRFPYGLNYEDAYWHICYLAVAHKVNFISKSVYIYYRHPSGIMNDTFKQSGLMALDHVYIAEKIYLFLAKNKILDLYSDVLKESLENYFYFALQNTDKIYHSYIIYETGRILRDNNINISSELMLNLKQGTYLYQDNNIIKDAKRWRKIQKISYMLFPKGSYIRKKIIFIAKKIYNLFK